MKTSLVGLVSAASMLLPVGCGDDEPEVTDPCGNRCGADQICNPDTGQCEMAGVSDMVDADGFEADLLDEPDETEVVEDLDEEIDCTGGYEQGTALNGRTYDPHYDFTGELYFKFPSEPLHHVFFDNACSISNPCDDGWTCDVGAGVCRKTCSENEDCEPVTGYGGLPYLCEDGFCTGWWLINGCTATLISLDEDYPTTREGAVLTAGHCLDSEYATIENSDHAMLVAYDTCRNEDDYQRCDDAGDCEACGEDYACMGNEGSEDGWCKRRIVYQGVGQVENLLISYNPRTGADLGLFKVRIPDDAPLPETLDDALASLPRAGRVVMQPLFIGEGVANDAPGIATVDEEGVFHDYTIRKSILMSDPRQSGLWLDFAAPTEGVVFQPFDSGGALYNTGPPSDIRTMVCIIKGSSDRDNDDIPDSGFGSWLCDGEPLPGNISWIATSLESLSCSSQYWSDLACELPEYHPPHPDCPADDATGE